MHSKNFVKLVCFVITLSVVLLLLINMSVNGSPLIGIHNYNTLTIALNSSADATPTRVSRDSTGPTPTKTIIPTKTPVPTKTIIPTKTPVPTKTIIPTKTPVPTTTIIPTATPVPTTTPTPTIMPTPTSTPTLTSTPAVTPADPSTKPSATVVRVTPRRPTTTPTATPVVTDMPEDPKPGSMAIVQRFYVGKQIYYVNNDKKEMDTAPVIKDGRTLLPVRYVSETVGAKVDWDGEERKVTIMLGEDRIELWIDKEAALVNGELKRLDVAPTILNNRTVLPLRFVTENLGMKVEWNGVLQEILITSNR